MIFGKCLLKVISKVFFIELADMGSVGGHVCDLCPSISHERVDVINYS